MAHAAGLNADADMPRQRVKQRLLGQLQLARTNSMDGPIRFSRPGHSPLPLSRGEPCEMRSQELSPLPSLSQMSYLPPFRTRRTPMHRVGFVTFAGFGAM